MEILEIYEEESGQKVNKNKTAIFFSKSTPEGTKDEIKEALSLQEIVHYDKYLRLPSLVGRKKKGEFQFYQAKSVVEIIRLGRKAFISSGAGDIDKGYHSGYSNICYGVLQNSVGTLP